MIKIENTFDDIKLKLVIDTVGAQIVDCVATVDGQEIHLMHNGATTSGTAWDATAKNLFPNPGPVLPKEFNGFESEQKEFLTSLNQDDIKTKLYTNRGGIYAMTQHGFAQNMKFDVQGKTKTDCVLSIRANETTTTKYPNNFAFYVVPSLDEYCGFTYQMFAKNLDIKPMIAGMGWHPSFALPFGKENYHIVVAGGTSSGVSGYEAENVINKGKATKVNGGKESSLMLVYTDPKTKLHYKVVSLETDAPNLVLWGKDGKNSYDFICLEPWNSESAQISKLSKKGYMSDDEIYELRRQGACVLAPDEETMLETKIHFGQEYLKLLAKHLQEEKGKVQ